MRRASILIIYTGGTIGMALNQKTGLLQAVNFIEISSQLPELHRFDLDIKAVSFSPPIDSSEIDPDFWVRLASTIEENYNYFDGFVILHGTDTMAYTASALSFMFENLTKPIILTGSQLPIGTLRTDGKENLISSIEIASARHNGEPIVPEVCIFFQNKLFRGNRTTKQSVEFFNAFKSENYPLLAETGIEIRYNHNSIYKPGIGKVLKVHKKLNENIAILKLFPGISLNLMRSILNSEGLKGVIIETYGSGNAPTDNKFISEIKSAIERGTIIINRSQCSSGSVDMHRYKTGQTLLEAGVVSGYDITIEAAVTKLMHLLGEQFARNEILSLLNVSIRGEMSQQHNKLRH